MLFYNVKAEHPGFDRTTLYFLISAGLQKERYSIEQYLSFLLPNILMWNGLYDSFAEFCRLQRIFSWIKSCKSLNIMVPGAGIIIKIFLSSKIAYFIPFTLKLGTLWHLINSNATFQKRAIYGEYSIIMGKKWGTILFANQPISKRESNHQPY